MEAGLRLQILRAAVRDRNFLKSSWRDVRADDFPETEEKIIAGVATRFYEKYEEPIGAMLRSEAEDEGIRQHIGSERKKKLRELLDTLLGAKMELVPVKALEDRLAGLKHSSFYERAIEDIIAAHEQHKLGAETLSEIVDRAQKELHSNGFRSSAYFDELEHRIDRRKFVNGKRFPLLLIEPLDEKIKAIGRKHLGMFLASYASGKGLALLHVAVAYAMQGLNVLHITLEDPMEEVENRLDAALTGIPMNRLADLPNRLKKRFKKIKAQMRGRIQIVDGTDSNMTVSMVERIWEQKRQKGFTADVIIIDYDDELECEKPFKGESARRFEFAEIYKRLRRLAAKLDVIVWTAAQGTRGAEGKKIVTGKDAAEDISKCRKAFLAIGIGSDPEIENLKHLYVIRHRLDRSRFAVKIMSDYSSGIFYDREATVAMRRAERRQRREL